MFGVMAIGPQRCSCSANLCRDSDGTRGGEPSARKKTLTSLLACRVAGKTAWSSMQNYHFARDLDMRPARRGS